MITTVIFDYGNVISMPQVETAGELEKLTGVPAAVFENVYETFRFDFDRGIIDGEEMYRRALDAAGYHEIAKNSALLKRLVKIDMDNWGRVNTDVIAWGLSLQKQGYKLGILSNIPTEFLDAYEKDIPLFTVADYACFSCRVKLIKPEEAIYRDVLAGLQVAAHEAVFFDDLPENIAAANALGIYGIQWTGLADAQKAWAQLGQLKKFA